MLSLILPSLKFLLIGCAVITIAGLIIVIQDILDVIDEVSVDDTIQ